MPDSPVTVFLFTDIEGSTRLWEQFPADMRHALERHDAIAAQSVASHGGRVVKTTGDGVHAVFRDPLDGVSAAVAMQLALAEADFGPDITIRVRAGLHAGIESERDNDFYGTAVNRAARIMSVAHGGQVIVSQAVASLLHDRLPGDLRLQPLGRVRLRDLRDPEEVFQVVHPRLRAGFPALRSLEGTPNNLPHGLTSFIGRERELAELHARLRTTRLLTIFGIGGLGKSRLSLQVAASALDDYGDGVWFVELAPVADPRLVAQTLASVLGLRDDAGASPQEAIRKFVRDRRLLIVLDNCEHLTQACAELARDILQSGPNATILATSRERLGIAGEQTYPLAPFEVPPREALAPEVLASFASVRLLSDRATSARPDFAVTTENAGAIATICQQLDGIPLALELAAARVRSMSVQRIAERLGDRFKLLSTGDRTALPRQQTLRALIDWSYDLLSPDEQALFRRLSVFAGGFTLEAAEAVAQGGAIAQDDVQDLLGELVDKSLVILDAAHDRYRMLETVRQYASEVDDPGSDREQARARHLDYFVGLAECARAELDGPAQRQWLARLDREIENILAAHRYCDSAADGTVLGLRLVSSLTLYWVYRGKLELGRQVAGEALARKDAQVPALTRCRALFQAGHIDLRAGRYETAAIHLREALTLARGADIPAAAAAVLQTLAVIEIQRERLIEARSHLEESLRIADKLGDRRMRAGALNEMGQLDRLEGRREDARANYETALALALEFEDSENVAVALLNLSMVEIASGDAATAARRLMKVRKIVEESGSKPTTQSLIEVAAVVAAACDRFDRAARLFGAAAALAAESGLKGHPADAAFLAPAIARTKSALGDSAWRGATQRHSLAEALGDVDAALAEARS